MKQEQHEEGNKGTTTLDPRLCDLVATTIETDEEDRLSFVGVRWTLVVPDEMRKLSGMRRSGEVMVIRSSLFTAATAAHALQSKKPII